MSNGTEVGDSRITSSKNIINKAMASRKLTLNSLPVPPTIKYYVPKYLIDFSYNLEWNGNSS